MRLFVFYDLPTITERNRKDMTKFRTFLIKNGFTMVQESIYMRFCLNYDLLNKYKERLIRNAPKYGDVRLLGITERQYQDIDIITGEKSRAEELITIDSIIVI